jgi:hypothetical protein
VARMYESRAYDNEHGDPVVVLVTTGTHDVSRLVNLLAGSRMALCEHMGVSELIVRQVKRHNGGRAALKLLAAHGGHDFTDPADETVAAENERLRTELARAVDALSDVETALALTETDGLVGEIGTRIEEWHSGHGWPGSGICPFCASIGGAS